MKILYIAPYRDGTGYSHAALEYINALDSVGVELVTRPVKMTPTNGSVDKKIERFEKNTVKNVDVVIQHNLPSEFIYKSGVKNIGMYAYETSDVSNTGWISNLSMMDKVGVFCNQQKDALANHKNIYDKTFVIPHPVNVDKFNKPTVSKIDFNLPKNCVKFYTICEMNRRKNLHGLLTAYLSTFTSSDNVVLIVKTSLSNRNPQLTSDTVKKLIENVKSGLNRFINQNLYPKILLFTQYLSEDQILSFHNSCDVYVTTSYGESFCLPALDALACGNVVIAPKNTAFIDYLSPTDAILCECIPSMVFGMHDTPHILYTSNEQWWNTNPLTFGKSMLLVYKNIDNFNTSQKRDTRKKYIIDNFSYNIIGNKLVAAIKE